MNLKVSQLYFRVPIRLYDPHHDDEASRMKSEDENVPWTDLGEFMKGYLRILVEDIVRWEEYLSVDTLFKDIDKPELTRVKLVDGDSVLVMWDMKTFEKELDLHIQNIKDIIKEQKAERKAKKKAKKLAKKEKKSLKNKNQKDVSRTKTEL